MITGRHAFRRSYISRVTPAKQLIFSMGLTHPIGWKGAPILALRPVALTRTGEKIGARAHLRLLTQAMLATLGSVGITSFGNVCFDLLIGVSKQRSNDSINCFIGTGAIRPGHRLAYAQH
jgi:hypothetical protein